MSNYLKHKPGSIEEIVANQTSKFREDSGYQKMFRKELDKAGKGIGSMSPAEKKAFFNKIDKKYSAKDEGMETMVPNKKEDEKRKKEQATLELKLKKQAIKDEIKLEKERARDIKIFLRKEQALIRKEQAERQKKFLQELKLEQQIEKFRIREIKELEKLERIALKEKRSNKTI